MGEILKDKNVRSTRLFVLPLGAELFQRPITLGF